MIAYRIMQPWLIVFVWWSVSVYVIGPHEPLMAIFADSMIKFVIVGLAAWQVISYLLGKKKNESKRNLHTST